MKIAFFSCFDAKRIEKQDVWSEISEYKPNVLILLGDNIYMDYGLTFGAPPPPSKYTDQEFLTDMYSRYQAIWNNEKFQLLISNTRLKLTTWDDHDFAWNGCQGEGKEAVPIKKKLISKYLHLQFREAINTGVGKPYPITPDMDTALSLQDSGIQYSNIIKTDDGKTIKVVLTDTRYYRGQKDKSHSLLGEPQKKWIESEILPTADLNILCSGSTLSDNKESWERYSDYEWLKSKNFRNFIVFSGDIHKNKIRKHKNKDKSIFFEFVSSGLAEPYARLPFGIKIGNHGHWGLLEIDEKMSVSLFKRKSRKESLTL